MTNTENSIISYIHEQDRRINLDGALSLEQWKQRISFKYGWSTSSNEISEQKYDRANIDSLISDSMNLQTGKIGWLWNENKQSGIKIWVNIIDSGSDGLHDLEDNSTNANKGNNFNGLIDTAKIVTNINMQRWMENLSGKRQTEIQGLDSGINQIASIIPPSLSANVPGGYDARFSSIEQILKNAGYNFTYQWRDTSGKTYSSNELPTNFKYDVTNPIINLTISYNNNEKPEMYIFGDNPWTTNSKTIQLSLNIKKTLFVNLNWFESMSQDDTFNPSNKNISISSEGAGDSSTISNIQLSWLSFEDSIYTKIINDVENPKDFVKILYSINDSSFSWSSSQIWTKVNDDWKTAVLNNESIGKLRFYSPQFIDGTKIQATVNLTNEALNDYEIKFIGDKNTTIVNHGLGTTIDLSQYAQNWTNNKAIANPGSTANQLDGFTLAPYNGISFDEFEEIAKNKLGLLFQYSNDNIQWVDSRDQIKSVNENDPSIYMRLSSSIIDYDTWKNNLEIKIDESISNTISNNENEKWTKAIKITLNLPKYLRVEEEWINTFLSSNQLSGNTKYLSIDANPETQLVEKIIQANPVTNNDPAIQVWVEYRLGDSELWFKRDEFINHLKNQNVDATTNKIDIRLAVNPVNEQEPIYAIEQNVYVLNQHDISESIKVKIFINQNYENAASNVIVYGSDDSLTYNYGSLPIESGIWVGSNGLMIQYTVDQQATYQDELNSPRWSSEPLIQVDPRERYLAIRIVAKEGYVYSANFDNELFKPNPKANIRVVNTENIKSKISVNLEDLKNNLVLEGYSNQIDLNKLLESERQVLGSDIDKLSIRYKVQLNDGSFLNREWTQASEMINMLIEYSKNYDNNTQGLIKFSANGIEGAKIFATYFSINDKFVPIDENLNIEDGIDLNTDRVKTKIDLQTWFTNLKEQSTLFDSGSSSEYISGITPPGVGGNKGEGFLSGLTYEEIVQILDVMGLKVEFQAPGTSNGDNWVPLSQINSLNNSNELFIRINLKTEEWKDSLEVIGSNASIINFDQPEKIQLKINLPITIIVNPEELLKLKFEGTTINITNFDALKAKQKEIIDNIIKSNQTGNEATDNEIKKLQLSVEFSLNELEINPNAEPSKRAWVSLDEMQAILSSSKVNYGTNRVLARFVILDNPIIEGTTAKKYQLSNDISQEINAEEFSNNAPFKVYIHNVDQTNKDWMFENLKLKGSQEEYIIENHQTWLEQLPKGLTVEYNSLANENNQPSEQGWSTTYNENPIANTREYWVRFRVQEGFVFEGATQDNSNISEPIALDTSKIVVNLVIESEWLNSIILSGNTKNLQINENNALQTVEESGQIIIENIIIIQYSIDGINWYKQEEFIQKLIELDGALDENNWVIKREQIQARFILNDEVNPIENPYGLVVDGQLVINNNQSPKKQLISDEEGRNSEVKGYINANKLTPFVASNFEVNGTNTRAILRTKNTNLFNQMLELYASDNIFKILYTSDNNLIFTDDQKVWNPGQGIQEYTSLSGNFTNRFIAIALQTNSEKYDVYYNSDIMEKGYILQSPQIPVYLSVEIDNPLLIAQNTTISFLNDKQPIFIKTKVVWSLKFKPEMAIYCHLMNI